MASSLQQLWGTLNILQLMLHTPLLNIQLTEMVFTFCAGMVQIVNFQIFSAEPLTNLIFGEKNFAPEALTPLNERFDLLGYNNKNIIMNMDLSLYILFSCIASAIAFFLFKLAYRVYPTCVLK